MISMGPGSSSRRAVNRHTAGYDYLKQKLIPELRDSRQADIAQELASRVAKGGLRGLGRLSEEDKAVLQKALARDYTDVTIEFKVKESAKEKRTRRGLVEVIKLLQKKEVKESQASFST